MKMSKLKETNEKLADGVVKGYKKIEEGVVGAYKKVEDKFVDTFLAHDGESKEDAKKRLAAERSAREHTVRK